MGKKNGLGVMNYSNNDEYDGEWKNDMKNGFGKMIFHNGTV